MQLPLDTQSSKKIRHASVPLKERTWIFWSGGPTALLDETVKKKPRGIMTLRISNPDIFHATHKVTIKRE